ncbi:MAG: hemolysin family protein [Myxococcota bacterium]
MAATLFFVATNAFFVAAEFALVKMRASHIDRRAEEGSARARVARNLHHHLDRYLSACQLGVTISSLILGWIAEPAVAEMLLAGAGSVGWIIPPDASWLHGVALGVALAIVTVLHITLGEQAPKIWAIHRAETTALAIAYPLRVFAGLFWPFISVVNEISNLVLRGAGIAPAEIAESAHSVEEIKTILVGAASAGTITARQLEIADNVFDLIALEARHILVPRVDAVTLSLANSEEENLRIIRESGHSRLPLCRVGLDSVIGIVHTKDVMKALLEGTSPDLERIARPPVFVPDTQPLSQLIVRLQQARTHCAVAVDEHGTAIGLVFLEDAIEILVGPIADEFDGSVSAPERSADGSLLVPGDFPLPEAAELLGLRDLGDESDTIGGHIVTLLGRMPRPRDEVEVRCYRATVLRVSSRRIELLRFEKSPESDPG